MTKTDISQIDAPEPLAPNNFAPLKDTWLAVVDTEPSVQVVDATAGEAMVSPAGNTSVKLILDSVTDWVLIIRIVSSERPPERINIGLNDLSTPTAAAVFKLALKLEALVAFWSLVTAPAAITLVAASEENKDTFTCKVQLADGARVPPTKDTEGAPPVATMTLPLQVVTALGFGDKIMPAGKLSTTPKLVNLTVEDKLVTVIVRRDESLAVASAVGENVLLTLAAVGAVVLIDALTGVVVAICPSALI